MSLAKNATALLSKLPDQTAAFLADGYLFQERLRKAEGRSPGDARPLATRLLGRPALIVRGKEGVDLFYDTSRMKRDGAMPLPVRGPLFGVLDECASGEGCETRDGDGRTRRVLQLDPSGVLVER